MASNYQVIVVDPPWPVQKLTHKARPNQTQMDYSTLSVDKIASLRVGTLAADDCWLFLWATQKHVLDAYSILATWGFHYLLTMGWEKTYGRSAGMPLYGFRWNLEFVLVGYNKVKPTIWPSRPLIPAAFSAVNQGHSVKPDRFYTMIEGLGSPRIDLFARRARPGWDVWGNEVQEGIVWESGLAWQHK
jgi:N6-adenosine-specific RNA methylase IME4